MHSMQKSPRKFADFLYFCEIEPEKIAKIYSFTYNLFSEHPYVIEGEGGRCIIIDPGFYSPDEKKEFMDFLDSGGLTPEAVLLTHGHIDHVWGVKALQDRFGIPVFMKAEDRAELDFNVKIGGKFGVDAPDCTFAYTDMADGQTLEFAGMKLEVITTPGHSIGSVCYLDREGGVMFTGDTLFAGCIGRTDLSTGDYDKEIVSIMEKLMVLDGGITIYPGHGAPSTIARERESNPFLEPFNEPEEPENPELEGITIHG